MSRYGKAVLVLAFALTVAVGGLILTRQVIAVAGEADAERLSRAVLEGQRDLGDLADPRVSARFALAYLRDIMGRKPNIKDALTEYNGGPAGRHPHYYRMVMGAYVEILERSELRCRLQPAPKRLPVLAFLTRV